MKKLVLAAVAALSLAASAAQAEDTFICPEGMVSGNYVGPTSATKVEEQVIGLLCVRPMEVSVLLPKARGEVGAPEYGTFIFAGTFIGPAGIAFGDGTVLYAGNVYISAE